MTPDERNELNDLQRRVQTLEHQHTALLATIEKALRRIAELEKVKTSE